MRAACCWPRDAPQIPPAVISLAQNPAVQLWGMCTRSGMPTGAPASAATSPSSPPLHLAWHAAAQPLAAPQHRCMGQPSLACAASTPACCRPARRHTPAAARPTTLAPAARRRWNGWALTWRCLWATLGRRLCRCGFRCRSGWSVPCINGLVVPYHIWSGGLCSGASETFAHHSCCATRPFPTAAGAAHRRAAAAQGCVPGQSRRLVSV